MSENKDPHVAESGDSGVADVKFVYDFTEGNKDLKDLLGGKGANLAEMTNLGLPVPPGFTITTEACKTYLDSGDEPAALRDEVSAHLDALEAKMGKKLGQADDPLLVSVRSGAKFSMPGMMDTVLNIGLSDKSVQGLAKQAGDDRFAWDSYRRLIQMFGKTVLGVEGELFEDALEAAKDAKKVTVDTDLEAADLKKLVTKFKKIVKTEAGRDFPQDPREQMDLAIHAVFDSWNTDRAKLYRRQERIPGDLGTAVNVCSMVFGNLGPDSGTGVAFTRDPASGHQGVYGDYLQNAQGEDVVAGIRNTVPLAELEQIDKKSYDQLMQIMATLENHYKDLCDIEFTIERGQLWMLQTRVGKRTAGAAFRIATQLVDQGLIDEAEALQRVNGAQLAQLMFPRFDDEAKVAQVGRGIAASPGAAVGKAVFDSYTAVKWSRSGEKVILVRRETNPDDLDGMIAAEGILTSRGGKTSHAAVVARGMGKTCVCGAEELEVDTKRRRMTVPGGHVVEEGDVISIDGSSGKVYLGEVPVVPSPVVEYFEGRMHAGANDADELVEAVHRIMAFADRKRRLRVRANADNAEDALRARRFGAQGIGLCRTEHMFLGDRRELVERLILADTEAEREESLKALLPLQKQDFVELFSAMDGLPVTVRLLDPPLHEFLPDITELSVRVALAESRKDSNENDLRLLQAVHRLHEQNPMLGLRGVRLGLVIPGLFTMQVRAIAEAVAERKAAKADPRAEIMIPLVGTVQELEIVREEADQVIAEVQAATGTDLKLSIGTMIELPRAALTAGQIAEAAEFFSFGTNDLTQTVWGFSRDDVEASFFTAYLEKGIFGVSPFETIDRDGVGSLVKSAVKAGRETRPDLKLGVCGEHGGDPESVHFFHEVGLDYVSCSPFRIPVARLEAGRAASSSQGSDHR
ncbi:pyruvate, phosphate dikinase [Streptomyces phaeochromogenes]|uniref:Pyruvate, phosphate dikinase n=1 Tax=Streptomyces phaeochromogenes TaxID=1923 RepID=A0ABZ1HH51_STRPH|nr:pyruvate, phosphate dikinase [Streptomyces phaeochromogenes]MCX5596936.1 pyruvate, phosphate dikinase [Streptomyces phaeochromogenes]WRZ32457.1 pyruvate, phosphate dikinase [Streptomyces phaeochromogenes]WSD17923.1 pyruvate, phosphate dikinase [Streptomyces phaeochromogenes]WSS96360.1 pyruvate, phosphate dikinase [Streptomyces phaeochromogenes]WSW14603.1 pyruvate, phosphate dikinase [Streptomyces phaeochromogenes]